MKIIYTKHARVKFQIYKRHKIKINEKHIKNVLQIPKIQDYSEWPEIIAVGTLDVHRSLIVVYKKDNSNYIIITFWPAKKGRYESKIQ